MAEPTEMSTEISTVALITAKEGSADVIEQALRTLAAATHEEEGCLHYSLHRGTQDPNTFVTIEKWRSAEDLDAHMKSDHIASAMGSAREHFAAPPTIVPATDLHVGADGKGKF